MFNLSRLLSSGRQGELHFQGLLGTDWLSETGCLAFYHGIMMKFVRDSWVIPSKPEADEDKCKSILLCRSEVVKLVGGSDEGI